MQKVITIDGKQVPFKATASTTRRYRQRFQRDLLVDIQTLVSASQSGVTLTADALEAFEGMAYIMAQQADPSIPDDPDDWLDGFEMFSIYEVLPQLLELWGENYVQTSDVKKKTLDHLSGN